jgi:GNAT superfamily N-acetyltransferase
VGFGLVQLNRTSAGTCSGGGPAVVFVHPSFRRQGIGSALLSVTAERAKAAGVRELISGGATPWRFWPGIPSDLDGALGLFQKHGYAIRYRMVDLVRDLSDFEIPQRATEVLEREGVEIRPANPGDLGQVLGFEQKHFGGWEPGFRLVASQDPDHLLAAWRGDEIVGTLQMFSPRSRYRGANVVWERLLGESVGGIGAVGVAEPHRKKGLGLALVAVASAVLRDLGVGQCIIDWTVCVDFYGKLGYRPWREYHAASLVVGEYSDSRKSLPICDK